MAHDLGSAKKTFDTSDAEFTDDTPTREYYLKGIEDKIDTLGTALHEERKARADEMRALANELRGVAESAKATSEAITAAVDEIRKLTKLVIEERAERFALGDRVSAMEQRPTRARRK